MMTAVTAVMIAYNNEADSLTRLQRDLLPALRDPRLDYELIVIDNSAAESPLLRYAVTGNPGDNGRYYWQQGDNLMYGPALNLVATLANHPYLLYICTSHGYSNDPTWALDLLEPLITDTAGEVGMTGSLQDAGPPEAMGFPASLPQRHIQGGVFAARTQTIIDYPYVNGEFAQSGSDLHQCFQLMSAGLRLVDVPTIRSVWFHRDLGEGPFKYVHDSGWE